MLVLVLCIAGIIVFAIGAFLMGRWLRRHPSMDNAECSSRFMHTLFFTCLVPAPTVGLFYPGVRRMDALLGFTPLEPRGLFIAVGALLLFPGLYLLAATNVALRRSGHGANAFRLTRQIVDTDIYQYTRNPMSLGFYLAAAGLSLVLCSPVYLAGALLGLIPAHLLFIKYFEEEELALRFGEPYLEYKKRVPFLIPRERR